jgi:hypothetical protein
LVIGLPFETYSKIILRQGKKGNSENSKVTGKPGFMFDERCRQEACAPSLATFCEK